MESYFVYIFMCLLTIVLYLIYFYLQSASLPPVVNLNSSASFRPRTGGGASYSRQLEQSAKLQVTKSLPNFKGVVDRYEEEYVDAAEDDLAIGAHPTTPTTSSRPHMMIDTSSAPGGGSAIGGDPRLLELANIRSAIIELVSKIEKKTVVPMKYVAVSKKKEEVAHTSSSSGTITKLKR